MADFSFEEIREHWERQARTHGLSSSASWSDTRAIELEVRELRRWLEDGNHVLDVGCANGFSTVQFAAASEITVLGVDYVPEMIELARERHASLPKALAKRVSFEVGDVTDLRVEDCAFDRVITTRVIINLGDWERQRVGLLECIRVLRPGGLALFSEATEQGWRRMNGLRQEWGLEEIPVPPFNRYVDQDLVAESIAEVAEIVDVVDFASTYYVGTRVLKPLLIQATGADVDVGDTESEWNRWFATLPAWGDYGTQKLIVARKRS